MTTSSTSNLTVTELSEEAIAEQIERDNERTAVDGGQEDVDPNELSEVLAMRSDDGEPEEKAEKAKPIQMSPQDQKRLDMANRFKRVDPDDNVPFDGDMTKAENMYGSVAQEDLDPVEQPEVKAPVAAPAERKHKIIVRGKEIMLTDAELIERASKVEAADSYLEEGRNLLEQAKAVRAGRDPQHPEGETRAQEDGQDQNDRQPTRRPGPDLKAVVEEIQFGDPEIAAQKLGQIIADTAQHQANQGHVERLVRNDLAKSRAALKAFTDANAELAADPIASNVVENNLYGIYREEIKALGVDEAQIPQDPKALADWHRLYRVHGHAVSAPADALNKAKARFDQWRGVSSAPKPAVKQKDAPRVAVNVDRTERRMAIPNQPSRAVAPRRDAAPVIQENSRKSAVQEMRRARGQIVT